MTDQKGPESPQERLKGVPATPAPPEAENGPQAGADGFRGEQQPRGPVDWARHYAAQREGTNVRDKDAELRAANEWIERLNAELTETRTVLDEVLRQFVHKGHPGQPCLSSGWISEKTVARWRAVLHPPTPAHNAGPSIRECAQADRLWPLQKEGE
ncbi:hypothetical protein [Streptomyces sp. AHA2]|uniref:hypothetical protein n=1 Tax=Streptomyces sp. AHA2 TaxID=3064526 RepID=UPI002FE413AB